MVDLLNGRKVVPLNRAVDIVTGAFEGKCMFVVHPTDSAVEAGASGGDATAGARGRRRLPVPFEFHLQGEFKDSPNEVYVGVELSERPKLRYVALRSELPPALSFH